MKALIFEEHSSVLAHWWRERMHARTVVYLDAHLDLQHVNAARLRRLEQCQSAEEVTALEKPHALWPDRDFSYSLENFLYPASRLGFIDRLVWVVPPHVQTGYFGSVIKELQQMDGVTPEDLTSFRRVDGVFEGRLLGLNLTVCDYRQLEQIALPADSLIDIDTDYFVTVPGDRAWVSPRQVFEVLQRLLLTPGHVTISRSVGSGFMPLRYRFIADFLAALFEGRTIEAEHYDRLFQLEQRLATGERETAATGFRMELVRHPGCAATWHLLGLAEADSGKAAQCQSRAEGLSRAYGPSVLRHACEIRNRRQSVDLATVMSLERLAEECDAAEQGLVHVAIGLIYCVFGNLARAMACLQRASLFSGAHAELALEIARRLVDSGRADEAASLLNSALDDDKTSTTARYLLGRIDLMQGKPQQAARYLELASAAAPAWPELHVMLAQVHRALGQN